MLFVDVDGTLLMWPGGKPGRVPRAGEPGHGQTPDINRAMLEIIVQELDRGNEVVIWSTGGTDHAKMAAKLCELPASVICIGKPGVCYDDGNPFKRADVRRQPK